MPYANGDRKICSSCRADLPLSAFDKNRSFKDGLANQCHDCLRASRRKWREANPRLHKARHIKNRYGVALEEYEAMVQDADGKCPICGEAQSPPFEVLDLDHDHITGKVRGLLCRACNLALGGARDDPRILRALADYIEHHRASPMTGHPPPVIPTFYAKGAAHPGARLSEDQVREIRVLAETGISQAEIGARFGVTQANVSSIVNRRSWTHLEE